MQDAIINMVAQIIAEVLITLLGVLGAWLTAKLAKRVELSNINRAKDELIAAAQQTVLELQQTIVDEMKAKAADGKLTENEIAELSVLLQNKTIHKMSQPAISLLESAAIDISAIIQGAGEALICQMHEE